MGYRCPECGKAHNELSPCPPAQEQGIVCPYRAGAEQRCAPMVTLVASESIRIMSRDQELVELRARLAEAEKLVCFFACTIKCGEPWSETCETEMRSVLDARTAGPDA